MADETEYLQQSESQYVDSLPDQQPQSLPLWRKLTYGVGHIFNDLTSSMWFSYLLVYFHKVIVFDNISAGYLMLIGQIVDAISTTFVGIESDRGNGCLFFPKRRAWHFVGSLCVLLTFPFIFNLCIYCSHDPVKKQFWYYALFIVIFQFGWASVQISHLSLIPELVKDKNERVELNSIRYAFTVLSNLAVYGIFWLLFNLSTQDDVPLGPGDARKFQILVFIICGIGVFFTFIFHVGTKEYVNIRGQVQIEDKETGALLRSNVVRMTWKDWWHEPQFYMIFLLYMSTRLYVNVSQIYFPLYLTESIKLSKEYIALVPLLVYICGFFTSLLMRPINKLVGGKITYFLGLVFSISFCVWTWFIPEKSLQVFGTAALNGIGGSTILVTSLALSSELIGENTECGAFVFGSLSFFDKLCNGIVIVVIQHLHPCKGCCPECPSYERLILTIVPFIAALLALSMLVLIAPQKIGKRSGERLLRLYSANVAQQTNTYGSNEARKPLLTEKPNNNC